MYLKYVKKAFLVLPQKYKSGIIYFLVLSFVNLLLDLFSLALVIPLIIVIVGKNASSQSFINDYFNDLTFFDSPLLLTGLIILVIIVFVVKNSLSVKIINYQTKTCFALASEISSLFTQNYIYHDFVEFKKQAPSDVIRNSMEIPNEFIVYILIALNTILSELILLTLIFILGMLINPLITFLLFLIFMVAVLISQRIGKKKIQHINKSLADDYSGNISNLLNLMNGFFEIKTSGMEKHFLDKFTQSNIALNKNYATLYARNLITPKYIEVVIIVIIGSIILLYNYLPLSSASALLYISFLAAAAMKVIPSINKIITAFLNFKSHLFTIDIIEERLSKINTKVSDTIKPIAFNQKLGLQNITFSYNDKPLLRDITLNIKKGEIVTIVGDSGVGKSTLLNIITQLIKPFNGQVYIDDFEINYMSGNAFQKLLSYVPQNPFILEGTILENITMDSKNYKENSLLKLLTDFDLEKIINALPQKLDTFIGSNGHYLSGGQKQRIALIRSILLEPQILILDEATNQLEKELEIKLLAKLKETANENNMTILMVSHHAENIAAISDHTYHLSADGLKKI